MAGSSQPSAAILLVALAVDLGFGEPPNRAHPVAWLGAGLAKLVRAAPDASPRKELLFGAALAFGVPAALFVSVRWALGAAAFAPIFQAIAACALLKASFALRALGDAGLAVGAALERDLDQARASLACLCSRDARALSEPELVAATVESLAENCSDSFVAPIFYYLLFGVPGAVAYRTINTLDAMIGYRGRFEYLGKVAARLDDVANFVPARLTALVLILAGAVLRADVRQALATYVRDRSRTESPNAGQPMAVMAGLLRVELEKRAAYRLGDPIEPLSPGKIAVAHRLLFGAAAIFTAGALCALRLR